MLLEFVVRQTSLPMRGEWIEISTVSPISRTPLSLPMRGEWIEINKDNVMLSDYVSLPMRGEWIEIRDDIIINVVRGVSPHAGRVD